MPDVKVILEHVDVEKDKKITGIDKNVCLGFGPTQAQTVLDTIWRAGYRPTKEGK
jgi:ABC-type hemin transport system substrate-binding protein